MTKPSQRTRSQRIIPVKLPSGRRTFHFETRPPKTPACSRCGAELHGVVSNKPRSIAGSLRSASRPYSGVLCHNCLSDEIRQLVRSTGTAK